MLKTQRIISQEEQLLHKAFIRLFFPLTSLIFLCCILTFPKSSGLLSIVIEVRPHRDSGRLSSMDGHSSVDDRTYWRDADEGGRDVEPLHCKAHLQLWHKAVANTATSHVHVHVIAAFDSDLSALFLQPAAVRDGTSCSPW